MKLSLLERFSESFSCKIMYISEQKIPPMVCQHCQRSERAASLFLQTLSWLDGGSCLDYSTILVGGLLAASLYPGVPVLRFGQHLDWIAYIRFHTATKRELEWDLYLTGVYANRD